MKINMKNILKYTLIFMTFFMVVNFFLVKNVFAMDIPVFSLIVSENSSGYICSGDSIGCSSLSSIYKVEKRDEDIYICPSSLIGGCSPLNTVYKTSKYSKDTTYVCLSNSLGSCSTFNVLYKISKHDESTSYVCPGDSIGNCSIFNVLYKISKHDTNTTFACPGDSIGDCSIFNVLYKFEKTDTQSSGYSETSYNDQIKAGQDKIAQLEQEKQKLTEDYLNALNNLNTPQYTCPINSTLNGTVCSCNIGYEVSSSKTSCVKSNIKPKTSVYLQDGALIRAKHTSDIYIVKYVGAKKFKRLILSPSVFNSYGHLRWDDVIDLDSSVVDSFTTSNLVRAINDPKVYVLSPSGDTGERHWISSETAFKNLSLDWDSIYEINEKDRDSYVTGSTY